MSSLASRGVYTLLDLHQDCLWQAVEPERQDSRRRRKRKGYWGVPPWVKRSLPRTEPSFPWPLGEYQAWICGYFTKEISSGFQVIQGKISPPMCLFNFFYLCTVQHIYDNTAGTADAMAEHWRFMAEQFGQMEGIVG